MVKVVLNPGIRRMSGKMGDWTYRFTYGQQTIMKTPDMSKVKWSKAQKAHRQESRSAPLPHGGLRFLCREEFAGEEIEAA